MSDSARVDAGGDAAANGVPDDLEDLRSAFEAFNELVRTEGNVLTWVQQYFDPQARYRPIEDRDWFSDPHAITTSLVRWIEVWGVGKFRITPEHILELGEDCYLVTAHNRGVGRGSGLPIEAVTYIAMIWRAGRIVWFDEYLDEEAAQAAARKQTSAPGGPQLHARPTLAERVWKLSDAAFAAFVRRRDDRQLERLLGSDPALRAMFKRMEQVFEPTKAGGVAGDVQYELLGSDDVKKWVVRIADGQATTRPGEADVPVTTLRMSVPTFIRVAARELHPVKAYREGLLEVSGNFEAATRLNVMFGVAH